MDFPEGQILPLRLQELKKIVLHLQDLQQTELNDNTFILAKNIREYIININNNQLSVYDITNECIKYINILYMNSPEP